MNFHRILVPSDLSEATGPALEVAERLIADDGEVVLLHVFRNVTPTLASFAPNPISYDKFMAMEHTHEAKDALHKLRHFSSSPVRPVRIELSWGSVVDSILLAADKLEVDLIVLATHAPRGLSRVFGSVAEPVLRQAPCPVMTLRIPVTTR
ncbi:MAG: universal stress protein [Candidatus Xenobia bacterium]